MIYLSFFVYFIKAFNKVGCWLGIVCCLSFSNAVLAQIDKEKTLNTPLVKERGEQSFLQGDFETAIFQWTGLAEQYAGQNNSTLQGETLVKLANAYQALGKYTASVETLEKAHKLASSPQQKIVVMNSLGSTYLAMGEYPKANKLLQSSVELARKIDDIDLLVASLNNVGNLKKKERDFDEALDIYSESIELARSSGNNQQAAKSSVNAAITAFQIEGKEKVGAKLEIAKYFLEKTPNDHNKAFGWISLGQIAQDLIENQQTDSSTWQSFAYHALRQAERIGEQISDPRTISYAQGNLGRLYTEDGRYDEALQLTRQAIFAIEKIQAPEILYQWQWQTGRILKAKENNELAIPAYQQAVNTLHSIRQDLSTQQLHVNSFREEIEPIYLELADLLLQANDKLSEGDAYQQNLKEVRHVIEQLKAAELQDYFKNDCVSALQQKSKSLDNIDKHTAVIYPILLTDRIEILLSVPGGLKRFTVSTNREAMINEIRLFRQKLENRTTREYLSHARILYQQLITPLEETLTKHEINTLVIVPDEFLRTIPLAALHDGDEFLIEKYAIANTPGLNVTDAEPLVADNTQMLAVGLAESVQGFPALPHVSTELANINKVFGGTVLEDEEFVLNRVKNELKQTSYNIVHIASHGQFKSNAQENFVLTFDDKLNMNALEELIGVSKFRNSPVELLTLSACQTAAGDSRAALGLAGIAIKAGARSAIATLWFINDQAASQLVTEFYRQLKGGSVTKALAIKNAQVHMIKNTPYQHPYFWSPFLLIGNWL